MSLDGSLMLHHVRVFELVCVYTSLPNSVAVLGYGKKYKRPNNNNKENMEQPERSSTVAILVLVSSCKEF